MRALLIALCLLAAAPARADEEAARARARELKNEGAQAFERGENELALERFRAAWAVYPSANLRFNMGLALAKLGRELEAADEFDKFLDEAKNAPEDARAHARAQVAELERKLGRIEIAGDGRVSVDEKEARSPLRVLPGAHRVLVEKPGQLPFSVEITVGAGETARVEPRWTAIAPPPRGADKPRSRLAPILVGAGALAFGVTGAALRISAKVSYDELMPGCCTAAQIDPIKARDYTGWALLGIGGALLVVDVALWIVDARARRH